MIKVFQEYGDGMFGIGMPELVIILVVALIVIGPKKLPDLAKSLGKGLAEFRRATDDVKESLNVDHIKDEVDDFKDSVLYGRKKEEPEGNDQKAEDKTQDTVDKGSE